MLILLATLLQQDYLNDLNHKDPEIRKTAAVLLGKKKERNAVYHLIPLLADPDEGVRNSSHEALRLITGKEIKLDKAAWNLWWESEGKKEYTTVPSNLAIHVILEGFKKEIETLRLEKKTIEGIAEDSRNKAKALEDRVRTLTWVFAFAAFVFLLVMLWFAVYIASRIKTWRELIKQADQYINETKAITQRVDRITSEIDSTRDSIKNELHELSGKLRNDSKEEIDRYLELLQQNTDHRLREELMELRGKAEKELQATLGELKGQIDNEVRKVFSSHREKSQEDFKSAYNQFLKEIEAHTLYLEGSFYTSSGKLEHALTCFSKLANMRPNHYMALISMANIQRDLKRYDEALKTYHKALEISVENPRALYGIATTYARMNMKEKMFEYLQNAIKFDGEYKDEALNDPAFKEYWQDENFRYIAAG